MSRKLYLGLLLLLLVGCYPVSYVMLGEAKTPVDPNDVQVYADFPEKYEKIAIIQAGSDFAFIDPSFDFTHQQKTDKAMERLRIEAASLGANAIVLQGLSTHIKQNITATDDGIHSSNVKMKEVTATAIFDLDLISSD